MIRDQDHPLRKITLQSPIARLPQLSPYTGIPAHANDSRTPPLLHCHGEEAKVLFRYSHPSIIPILVIEVEPHAEPLCYVDAGSYKYILLALVELNSIP